MNLLIKDNKYILIRIGGLFLAYILKLIIILIFKDILKKKKNFYKFL